MAAASEATELKLVSSIRYKFASASGDEKKLSQALQSQLTTLLEKAGSPHKAVREDASSHRPILHQYCCSHVIQTFKAFMSVKNFVQPVGYVIPVN